MYIASSFDVTDVGRMRLTRCILLRRKARYVPVNHSRPLVKINAHSGNEYQPAHTLGAKNVVPEKVSTMGKETVLLEQIYTLLIRMHE